MNSLILAFNVVIPMMIYMLIGGLIKKGNILSEGSFKQFNETIFRVLLPLSLFFDVYESDLMTSVQPWLLALSAGAVVLIFAISWGIVPRLIRDKRDSVTVVQGIYRSNFVLFGTTISTSLCGERGAAVSAALAMVIVPLFNILAVILFEVSRGGDVKPGRLLLQIVKNPLVDAGILGAVFNLSGIGIPSILARPLMTLGDIASPLALLVLGGLLSFRSMAGHKSRLLSVVLLRLVVVPLVALPFFVLLGVRQEGLVALMTLFASPVAVSSVPMAQSMGGNGELAGEIVAVSSACSILTIFLFILTLSTLGLI